MNGEAGGPSEPGEAGEPARSRGANRLIVKLNRERYAAEEDLEREATSLAADIPGAVVERISRTGRVLLSLAEDSDPATLAAEVSQREGVDYAEPDVTDRAVDAED